ncbi:MAG: hypothetical protein NTU79_05910 [Planctomycetota bacterium]|nr:hypothetical protein [Planctomycetota bacterium]
MSNKDETVDDVPLAMPAIDASPWQRCKRVCLARILVGKGIHEFNRTDWLGRDSNNLMIPRGFMQIQRSVRQIRRALKMIAVKPIPIRL